MVKAYSRIIKDLRIWLLTIVICSGLSLSAHSEPEPNPVETKVVNSSQQKPERDNTLEAELEGTLGIGFVPRDRDRFEGVLGKISNNTPIETYVRAKGYQVLTLAITDNNLSGAVALAEDIIDKALTSNNANAIAEAHVVLAEAYLQRDEIDAAKDLIPAIEEYIASVSNPRVQYHAKHLIARTLIRFEEFALALENMLQAHAIISATNDESTHRRRQFLNLHITRLQANLGNYRTAIELADSTIEESLAYGLTEQLPDIYLVRAYARQYEEGPSQALVEEFLEAAKQGAAVGNGRVEMLGYNNAGAAELLMGDLDSAIIYLEKGIEVATRINNLNERSVTEFNLGYIKVLQGNYQQGIAEMLAAAEVFKTFALQREVAILLSHIADAYEMAGMYQEQAAVLKEQNRMRTELFQNERDRVISELQVRYEAGEQSLQIKLLEQEAQLREERLQGQQRNHRYAIAIAVLLIIILFLTGFAYRKSRKINNLLAQVNTELNEQSLRDPLTNLFNRRVVQKSFLDERRSYQGSHGLFLIDVDYFKNVNDKYGHDVGDEVLVEVSKRLLQVTRENDMVVRWGGEEFLLIIENIDITELSTFAFKILQNVCEKKYKTRAGDLIVTISGGGVPISANQINVIENWEQKLKQADDLLYNSKEKGRNQIHILTEKGTIPVAIK